MNSSLSIGISDHLCGCDQTASARPLIRHVEKTKCPLQRTTTLNRKDFQAVLSFELAVASVASINPTRTGLRLAHLGRPTNPGLGTLLVVAFTDVCERVARQDGKHEIMLHSWRFNSLSPPSTFAHLVVNCILRRAGYASVTSVLTDGRNATSCS